MLLLGAYDAQAKTAACLWLRKALSTFAIGLPDLYLKITEETRTQFKTESFQILLNEAENTVRNQIANTIGEVGGSLISDPLIKEKLPGVENAWPELVRSLYHGFC